MQGDPEASPVEIDRTDILALEAAAELLAAACRAAVAYDLGFASYDSTGLVNALKRGGRWLKLRNDGASQLQGAQDMLVASLDDVVASVSSFRAETDLQDDDFIKGISQASGDSILSRVAQVRQGLTAGYTLVADWDGQSGTPPTPLTIRFDRLFTQPIQDWKAVLPGYTVSTLRRSLQPQTAWESGTSMQTAQLDLPCVCSGYYYLYVSPGYPPQEYFSGPDSLRTPLRTAAQEQYQRVAAVSGFTGECNVSTSFDGSLGAGTQSIMVHWEVYYGVARAVVFVPVITWDADSYAEWIWNVAALNGLFPDLTTSAGLLSTFGYEPASWTKTLVLDWTGSATQGLAARRP
jgi:hypothetical protein